MFSYVLSFVFEVRFLIKTGKYLIGILVDFKNPLPLWILFEVKNIRKLRVFIVILNFLILVDAVLEVV